VVDEVQQHEVEGEHADQEHGRDALEEPAFALVLERRVVFSHG